MWTSDIICPHCGSEIENDDVHESQDLDCYVCDGQLRVEVEFTPDYTTTIIGEQIIE